MMHSMVSYGTAAPIHRFGSRAGTAVAVSSGSLLSDALLAEALGDALEADDVAGTGLR